MPNEKNDNPVLDNPVAAPTDAPVDAPAKAVNDGDVMEKVVGRVKDADNILVTLSRDPSVDEMAAAIGLTLALDEMGKHATAIYSGKTPNALEFLEPEKTFETNTNSLQDFIIALNKDKADHLRYKIEDEFVKVYITPYRTTINEGDLQFSHGDINVDLVISLNVKDVEDLDAALEKHGRIMHDASTVNISNDVPGKLGGIEWDEPQASSISEMIVNLIEKLGQTMSEGIATALLTGVVSATDRFSNDKTTPETMEVSAKLMESGANQQLVAVNIERKEAESELQPQEDNKLNVRSEDSSNEAVLDIGRDKNTAPPISTEASLPEVGAGETASPEQQLEQMISGNSAANQSLMDELKTAVPEVAPIPEVTPAPEVTPVPEANSAPEVAAMGAPAIEAPITMPEAEIPKVAEPTDGVIGGETNEPLFGEQQFSPSNSTIDHQVVIPSVQGEAEAEVASTNVPESGVYQTAGDMSHVEDGTVEPIADDTTRDYGAMMEKELAESNANTFGASPNVASNPAIVAAPAVATMPEVQPVAEPITGVGGVELPQAPTPQVPGMENMAGAGMPVEPSLPQVQSEVSADSSLPQVQPIDIQTDESAAVGVPAAPEGVEVEAPKEELNPVIVQPEHISQDNINQDNVSQDVSQNASQNPAKDLANDLVQNPNKEPVRDPALVPPVADPGAFKIPGM